MDLLGCAVVAGVVNSAAVAVDSAAGAVDSAAGTSDSAFTITDDSICAAVVDFPLLDLTPIWARDTLSTGGVGTSGSSTTSLSC